MADLREKVEAELQNIDAALRGLPRPERLQELSALELAGTAALLCSFYNGMENILKQILLARKVAIPAGAAWHRDLLNRLATRGEISNATRDLLAPYLAFRHFFSHAYGFDLDPDRLRPLVRGVPSVYRAVRRDLLKASGRTKMRK